MLVSVYGFEECVILLHTVLHIYPSVNMIVMCGASSLFMLGLFLIAILCLSLWLVGVCGRGCCGRVVMDMFGVVLCGWVRCVYVVHMLLCHLPCAKCQLFVYKCYNF